MSATSKWPRDLHGKIVRPKLAEISIGLKFGLWEDYTRWLDPMEQKDYWYDTDILEKANITIGITLGDTVIFGDTLKEFGSIVAHHVFEDMEPGACDLEIKISNLGKLPIRDDTGIFVCGMIDIETIKLQGVEIKSLAENTLFGNDASIIIPISKPIYPWMIDNWSSILPDRFSRSISDVDGIKRYTQTILSDSE